ncbi:MAG: phytanoyl-CoA dioxygenase family protein [Cyanobacteria bacterium]|nr:phytanoyl-CoA dioxygenase family protein [Cyanobacteriota bacterium]
MPLDLTGQPLIDRSDFEQLLEAGNFGRWSEQAISLREKGFCVIDLSESTWLAKIDSVVEELEPRLENDLKHWECGESGPPRLQDGWIDHESIRSLALEPMVLDLLLHLYGREPFAFQTLNFAVGSEQPFHSDAIHFHSYPHGFMCGVWIALQDVQAESGPLIYFPGSHRLPYLSARSLGLERDAVMGEPHPQRFFEPVWQQAVSAHPFDKQEFLPKRGELLIWHANLLHGGEPVQERSSRRWSQVIHYFFANCLYTTPMLNFASDEGGSCLRNPFDIAKGKPRYSEADWRDVSLTQGRM